jgi:hypothetical protein
MHEERVRQNNFGSGNRNRMEIEIWSYELAI